MTCIKAARFVRKPPICVPRISRGQQPTFPESFGGDQTGRSVQAISEDFGLLKLVPRSGVVAVDGSATGIAMRQSALVLRGRSSLLMAQCRSHNRHRLTPALVRQAGIPSTRSCLATLAQTTVIARIVCPAQTTPVPLAASNSPENPRRPGPRAGISTRHQPHPATAPDRVGGRPRLGGRGRIWSGHLPTPLPRSGSNPVCMG